MRDSLRQTRTTIQSKKTNLKSVEMYEIDWNIQFESKNNKKYQLALLSECEIIKSVDNLTDIATIVLPELIFNEPLQITNKIQRGSKVSIELGYDGDLRNEFNGFIKNMSVKDGSVKIICEDALYLFRTSVQDKYFKGTSVKQIAEYLAKEVEPSYQVECDYDITYEKFTIYQATAYDVLKKLKEETKANIFFDTLSKKLHIHQPYTHQTGKVRYSHQRNIETSNLEYVNTQDKNIEVTVECTSKTGKKQSCTVGTPGGKKVTMKGGYMNNKSLKLLAESTLKAKKRAKYKGDFSAWLIPYCEPCYTAIIEDEDYPENKGKYYISSVTTSIGTSGGIRKITPNNKLS